MADQRTNSEASQPGQGSQFGAVFWITVAISVAFVLVGVLFTEPFSGALSAVVDAIVEYLGWLYLLMVTFFLIFALFLAFSRYGRIRLGGDEEEPEFGRFAWFAMLFQAGMGIGIVFWGVSEPLLHYTNPPFGDLAEPETAEAASLAIQYSFFHWTLHPWGIYAVVGLAVAYFSFRKGMNSLRISSVFRPLIGDRVDGPIGKAIDVVAIVATLFGVAVSLGLGTLQIAAGLGEAFGAPEGTGVLLLIIGVTAIAYMLSASTPIDKGVNILSQSSIYLAAALLVFVFVVGPSMLQLNTFTQEIGGYAINLIPMSLRMSAFDPSSWLGEWTIFFWATWIAWAPYVGAFIARISRGRTIREFVLGVIIAPSLATFLWFAVFGASAINLDNQLGGELSSAASNSAAVALFVFLAQYPLALFTSGLAIFLVWIFFVAGADAGTIVLGSMSSGVVEPSRVTKLTWGTIMGALAAILLVSGGLNALQNGAILAATPFGILMLAMCWSLYKTLKSDYQEERPQTQGEGMTGRSATADQPTSKAGR